MERQSYLKLEFNKTLTISLKSCEPKQIRGWHGPELRWILSDGRALYTPESFRDRIKDLGIQPGQTFEIVKRRLGKEVEWRARHLPDLRGGQEAARILETAPELAEPEASLAADAPPMRKPMETALERALKTAVVACAEAEAHGKSIGYAIRFASSDVRALGITLLIGLQKRQDAA
jgi:hypothetical protein